MCSHIVYRSLERLQNRISSSAMVILTYNTKIRIVCLQPSDIPCFWRYSTVQCSMSTAIWSYRMCSHIVYTSVLDILRILDHGHLLPPSHIQFFFRVRKIWKLLIIHKLGFHHEFLYKLN
jgi:hypothetical protein